MRKALGCVLLRSLLLVFQQMITKSLYLGKYSLSKFGLKASRKPTTANTNKGMCRAYSIIISLPS